MEHTNKAFKHFETIATFFVSVLLISNIVSTKIVDFGPFTFDGGTLLFPLSYIFGDVLTEVYGYKKTKKVIWLGFVSALLLSLSVIVIGKLPADPNWGNQQAYDAILGLTPRIVLASLVAYFFGEFSNSFILAKLKIYTKGKFLFVRTISSTLVGELLDTVIFVTIAFYGSLDNSLLFTILISNYLFKIGVEIIFTPLTYKIVAWLKKEEDEDYYDKDTDFNPFSVKN